MPEENSKATITFIKALSIVLAIYICIVAVAIVVVASNEDISVTTVIQHWYNGLIDFAKGLFVLGE